MSWLLAFLGFALLIVFHELGHFFAAKWVGMRVEKFSLFFGKPIWSMQRGETTYQLASIPLGGFVKITGMNPEEELEPEIKARSYSGSPVWKRIFVISAGPFVNVVIAFLILTGIYLSQGKPVAAVAVGTVEPNFASEGILKDGDRILRVTVPAGDSTDAGSDGVAASVDRTLEGDAPGLSDAELARRITAMTDLVATGGCGARSLGTKDSTGRPQVAACEGAAQPFTLLVSNDGKERTVEVTPRYDEKLKRYRLGISFGDGYTPVNVVEASGESVAAMWRATTMTAEAMVKVVYDSQARKEVSSVVGGYETTRQSIEVDTTRALLVLALISLSLAIINLFPFLPLDGGHIFWAIVEKLRGGKPVATHVLEKASIVGFALVLMLFAIGLTNDLNRIFDGTGFGVR